MADTDTLPNGTAAAEEDERLKQRPADIDADVREMERRKRVEALMSSKLFREELERVLDQQLNEGSDAPLLQRIKEMVGGRLHTGSLRGPSCVLPINDIRGIEGVGYEKGEKILRCKLAAVYRLVDLFGWTQTGQSGQITARLNTAIEQVLTTPRGLLPHEVTASSLVKVDMQGQVVDQGTTNFPPNVDGFAIHGVVHAARPDVRCVVHVRSLGALAVSASRRGLVPLCPEAAALGEVAYHRVPYGPLDNEERDKIVRALGPHAKVLMLTSNGALCCGGTLEEAFFQARQLVAACEVQLRLASIPLDDLQLIDEETRKQIYDAAHTPPADTVGGKWRAGGEEFEALMRMLDNAGFRTGYIYRRPLVKNDVPKPRNDVEVPPAVSSLGYLLEEEELYRQGLWKRGTGVAGERTRWLNSPNVYQKVEVLETGTNDPRRITKWVDANNDEWVQDGSPANSSTPVKIHTLQFVPKNTNPKEFKALQQQIKDNRRADKISAGPQSHILEGVTWDEASKLVGEDAANTHTGDHVVLMGAASKGIIQRGYQHNATMYSAPYARNPFDHVSDREIDEYRRTVERKQRSDYDTDLSESEALSAAQITSPASQPSETEEESRDEHRVLRIETKQVPVRSQPEVVLSDDEPRDPNLLSDDEVFLDSPITSGLTSPTSELTDLAGPTSGMTSPMPAVTGPMPAVTGPMPAMPVQGPIVIRAHHAPMQQTVIRGTPKLSPELAEALSTSKRSVHDYPRSTNFDSVVKVYGSPETGDKKLTDLSLDFVDNEVESKKEHPKCKVSLNTRLEVKCDALEVFNPGCNSSRSSLYSIPSIEWDGRCKSEYVLRTQSLPRQRSREKQDRLYRTRSHSGFVNSQIKDPEPKHFHLPRCRSCGAASSSYALETGKEERGRRIPTSLYLSVDNIPQRCLEEELNIVKVKERQVPVFKVDKGNSNDLEFVDSQEFNEDNYIDIGNSFSSDNQTVIEKNGASDQDETVKDDTLKAESGIDTVSNETDKLYRAECVTGKDDSNSSNVDVDATISTEGEYLSFSEDMDFEHSAYESPVKDLVEKDIRDYSVPINFYCEDYQKKEGSPVKSPFKILENVKQNLLEPILEESKSFTADDSGNLSGNTDVIGLNRVSADNAEESHSDDCDIIPQSNFKSDSQIEPRELFAAEVNVSELIEQFQDKIYFPDNIIEPNIGDSIKHKDSNEEKDEEELAQHFPDTLNDNMDKSNLGNCIDYKGSNAMELEEPELALHSSENDNLNKRNIVDKESNATEVQEMEERMNFPANIIECHIGDSIKYNECNEDEEEIELAQHFPNNATDILNKCTIGDSVEIKDSNATEVQETELAIHFLDKMNDVQSNKFDITDKFEHRENIATIGDSIENKDSKTIEIQESELAIHFLDKMNDVEQNKFDIKDNIEHRENNATVGDSVENKDSNTIEIQESELAIHFLDKINDVQSNIFDITDKVEHREINATEVAEAELPEHYQEKLQDPGEYDININNKILDESIDVIVQNFIDDLLERAISIFQLKIEIENCPDKVTVDILEKECVEKQESFVVCDEDDTVTSDVERVSMIAVQTALEIYSNSESEGVEQDAVHLEQDVVVETVIDNVFEILSNNALLESGETYHKDRWSAASLASSGLERRSIDTTIEFEKNEAIADVIALLLKKVDVVTDRGFLDNVTKDRHVIINFNSKETLKIMEIESSEESEATTVDTTDSDCRFDNFDNFSISKIIQDIERSESLLFASDISDSDSIDSLKVIEGFVYYILDQVYFRIASKDNLKIEKSVKKVVTIVDHEDILYTALPIWSHSGVSPQKMYENHEKQEKDAAVSLVDDIEASLFNKGGPMIKDDDDDELLVTGGFLGVKSVDLKLDEYNFNEMRNISAPTNSEQSIIDDEPVCCGICLNINTNVTSDTSVASDLTDVDQVTTVHQTEIVKKSISCNLDNPSTETMNSIAVVMNQIDFQSAIDNDNFNKEDANIVSSNISLQFVTDLEEPSEYTQSETLRKYNKDHESKYVYEKITYKSIDSTESIIIIDDVNTEIVNENTQHESVNHLEISSVKAVVQTTYDEFNTDKTIEITNGVLKSDHVINIQDDAQNFEIAEKLPFKGDGEAEHSHVVEHVYAVVVTEEVYEKHEFEHNRDDLTERFSADLIDVADDCTEEDSYNTAAGIIEDVLERSSSLQCEISCLRCKEQQELRGADVDNFLNETFVIKDDEEEMNTAFVETNSEFYSRSSSPRDSTPFEICNESPIKNPNDNFIGNDLSVLYEKDDTLLGSPFVKQAPVISMSQIENTRGVKYWISFDDSLTEIEHRPLYRPIRRLDNKIPSFFAIDLNDTSEYETIETDSFWDVQDGKDTFKRSSVLYSADKAIPTHEHDPRCNTNVKEDSYASCSSVDYKTCDSESLDSNALEKKLLYDSRIDLHSKPSRRYNSWPPFEETLLYRIVSKFRMSESFDPSEFDDVQFNTSL